MNCYGPSFTIIYHIGNTYEPPRPVTGPALLLYIPQGTTTSLYGLLRGKLHYYISHRKHLRASTSSYGASFTIIYLTGNIYEPPRPVTCLALLLYFPQGTPTSLHGLLWGYLYYYISHRKHKRASTACYGVRFTIIYPTGNTYVPPRPVTWLDLLLNIPKETPTSLHGLLSG
jgi:hypothetical protein